MGKSESFYNNASGQKQAALKQTESGEKISASLPADTLNINQKQEIKINMQHDLASMIKEKKLFLLDIDGTVALGSELLPWVRQTFFIQ